MLNVFLVKKKSCDIIFNQPSPAYDVSLDSFIYFSISIINFVFFFIHLYSFNHVSPIKFVCVKSCCVSVRVAYTRNKQDILNQIRNSIDLDYLHMDSTYLNNTHSWV